MHSKLPHINLNEYYQFITFRTNDSKDSFVSKIQKNHNLSNKNKQYQMELIYLMRKSIFSKV